MAPSLEMVNKAVVFYVKLFSKCAVNALESRVGSAKKMSEETAFWKVLNFLTLLLRFYPPKILILNSRT